ncbi:MAG: multicopper oxidase domain-containing protein [Actinobacteria bacterium]|nr:multicopper oxidase domain-containing protein [Actinomycetota bacterium]
MPESRTNPPRRDDDRSAFTSSVAAFVATGAFFVAVMALIVVSTSSGGGGSGNGVATAAPVPISMSEFKISPAAITMPTGGKLIAKNTGSMVHNLQVKEANVTTPDIQPGGSAEMNLSSLAPGTYPISCIVPGHAEAGMKGTVTVSDGAAGGGEVAGAAPGGSGSSAADSSASGSEQIDWAARDKAMADGMQTFLDSLKPGAPPLTPGQGNQKLAPTIGADGVKEFTLEASVIDWQTEPGKTVKAWAYNNQVPAPWIRVEPNDRVRIKFKNNLPASSDIHWHGISTPFDQDGVSPLTQPMVKPGESYTYEFTLPNRTELGMYHPHNQGEVAVPNGMFGVFQVGDLSLPRGRTVSGRAIPANLQVTQELPMVLNDAGSIGLSLNGKSYPATGATVAKPGDAILVNYYNEGLQVHPMHLHRLNQLVVAKDGIPLDQPYYADTVLIGPGERYSVLILPTAEDIGAWAWHCHILTHSESAKGLTGMVTALVVTDPTKPT